MGEKGKKKRIPKPANFVPDPTFPKGHRWHGLARCQAWNPSQGRQCMRLPVPGKRVCKFDGGFTPSGKDSVHYKHGGWSKAMRGSSLGDLFDAAMADAAGRDKYRAFVEGRILELLEQRDQTESAAAWQRIAEISAEMRKALERYEVSIRAQNFDKASLEIREVFNLQAEIDYLSKFGVGQGAIFDEIYKLIEQQRRQMDSQAREDERAQKWMSPMQVEILIEAIAEEVRLAIAQHVDDATGRQIMITASRNINKIINRGGAAAMILDQGAS